MMLWTLLLLTACEDAPPPAAEPPPPAPAPPPPKVPTTATGVPLQQVMEHMVVSRGKLTEHPGGGPLLNTLHEHGDLEPWFTPGTLSFDFDYRTGPAGAERRHTHNRVDLWRHRVVQQALGEGADATMGWDGTQAWIAPAADAFPADAQQWATAPYNIVAIPWTLLGASQVAAPSESSLHDPDQGTTRTLRTLSIAFAAPGHEAGAECVVYTDLQTNRVEAVRFRSPAPQTIVFYREYKTVQGVQLAHRFDVYAWSQGQPSTPVATAVVANVALGEPLADADVAPPPGAVVLTTRE